MRAELLHALIDLKLVGQDLAKQASAAEQAYARNMFKRYPDGMPQAPTGWAAPQRPGGPYTDWKSRRPVSLGEAVRTGPPGLGQPRPQVGSGWRNSWEFLSRAMPWMMPLARPMLRAGDWLARHIPTLPPIHPGPYNPLARGALPRPVAGPQPAPPTYTGPKTVDALGRTLGNPLPQPQVPTQPTPQPPAATSPRRSFWDIDPKMIQM